MQKISMEFISEYPIASLGRRNIAGLKIVRYFIYVFGMIGPTMLTCLETNNRSIMVLIKVFVEVLDSLTVLGLEAQEDCLKWEELPCPLHNRGKT